MKKLVTVLGMFVLIIMSSGSGVASAAQRFTTSVSSANVGDGNQAMSAVAVLGFAISVAAFSYGIVHIIKRRAQ